jgi:hypothetical protein
MYVIKHKEKDVYINGSKSNAAFASMDSDDLVPIDYARVFPTLSGAKTALSSWAGTWDNATYTVVRDHAKYDMMEIVPVKVTK